MKKTIESLKEAPVTYNEPEDLVRVVDHLNAAMETEFRCSEAVGISRGEISDYIKKIWVEASGRNIKGIFPIPATPFRTVGKYATINHIAGIASSGKRCAFLGSGDVFTRYWQSDWTGIPFVVHQTIERFVPRPIPGAFKLFSRSPQQTADFALIAHRLSELALLPGLILFENQPACIMFEQVRFAGREQVIRFLGFPEDVIESPTEFQKQIFGNSRRRIPMAADKELARDGWRLNGDVWALAQQAMQEFSEIVGRTYPLLETQNCDNSQIVIIGAGQMFDWCKSRLEEFNRAIPVGVGLIHPTLLFPLPADRIAHLVQKKKAVVYLSQFAEPARDPILNQMYAGLHKATMNGRSPSGMLYPEYPAYSATDSPIVYTFSLPGNGWDEEAFVTSLKSITGGKAKNPHFRLAAPEAKPEPSGSPPSPKGKQTGFKILYRDSYAYQGGADFANWFLGHLNLTCRMLAKENGSLVSLQISKKKHLPETAFAGAEVLVAASPWEKNLHLDIAALREGAALLLSADPEQADALWQWLPEEIRQAILRKKLRLYFFDPATALESATPRPENGSGRVNAALWGALLKIGTELRLPLLSEAPVKDMLDSLLQDGSLPVARAIEFGFANVAEIDYHAFTLPMPESVSGAEPAFAWEEISGEAPAATPEVLTELLRFYYEEEPSDIRRLPCEVCGLLSPHFAAFRDLKRLRYDYPLFLPEGDSDKVALPLKDLFDEIFARMEGEGEEKERRRNNLLRLEALIRAKIDPGREGRLSVLWDNAAAEMIAALAEEPEKQASLRKELQEVRQALKVDGDVLHCNAYTVTRVLHDASRALWKKQTQEFRENLDNLIIQLEEILRADDQHNPETRKPHRLAESVGGSDRQDLNFEEMAKLLEQTDMDLRLPEVRRRRIEETLARLSGLRSLFNSGEPGNSFVETRWQSILSSDKFNKDSATAIGQFEAQLRTLVEFFRAVRIARLEVENNYREEKHDPYFAEFTLENLSAQEVALFPPFPVRIAGAQFDEKDKNALLEVLATDLPLKILLIVEDHCDSATAPEEVPCVAEWFSRLAAMAIQLNQVYVLQSSSSNFSHWLAGFTEGLQFSGPALFCIYHGNSTNFPQLHPYLISAAALESRAFPAFCFHPGRGTDWADRFALDGNSQPEKQWPETEFILQKNGDSNEAFIQPFTFADFLSVDRRFTGFFRPVPRHKWHPNMVPLHEYLNLEPAASAEKVPYILMTDASGTLRRVLVGYRVVAATRKVLGYWKSLQELAGINNSHVRRALEGEKQRLEEEKQKELQELEQRHQAELEKTVEELAREIVSNIAAGLLGAAAMPAAGVSIPVSVPGAATPPKPAEPTEEVGEVAEKVEAEEEEEAISFDEPYIETPRCTSCNECTNLNPMIFAYNENKQAYIKDPAAGPYRDLVLAAEKCPVHIIHPGKPKNPDEPGLDEWIKRAEPYL